MWNARWASAILINAGGNVAFPLDGSGISDPPNKRVTASGFSFLSGMVMREDFQAGGSSTLNPSLTINHALSMSLPRAIIAANTYVSPAVGGDGSGTGSIPLGARFALPRSLDVDAMTNLHPFTRSLLKAARDYGIYVSDVNGITPYNSTYVGLVAVETGLTQSLYGQSNDALNDRILSEVYSVIQTYGIYRVTG